MEKYALLLVDDFLDKIQAVKRYFTDPITSQGFNCVYMFTCNKAFKLDEVYDYVSNFTTVICTNAQIFKKLVNVQKSKEEKITKATPYLGTRLTCKLKDKTFDIFYCYLTKEIMFNDQKHDLYQFVLKQVISNLKGEYVEPGKDILKEYSSLTSLPTIQNKLNELLSYPKLTVDVETHSLKHTKAGLASIAFGINKNSAVALAVDIVEESEQIKALLKDFFINYKGTLIFHNCLFDVCILTYSLFMSNKTDYVGMYKGLDILLKDFEDTKLIAYFCLNSCARPELDLKTLSKEYTGKYSLEGIDDIDSGKINTPTLLRYNAIDVLATWFVYNKYYPTLVADTTQFNLYSTLYKDSVYQLLTMQLVGMSINPERVKEVSEEIKNDLNTSLEHIKSDPIIQTYMEEYIDKLVKRKNAEYKKKVITADDIKVEFNPKSGKQMQDLLFNFLHLPSEKVTASGQDSVDTKSLIKIRDKCTDEKVAKLLSHIIDFNAVQKIQSTFIPVLTQDEDKVFGYFNLGSVVSGRLSASDSLQQLPSNSKYGKLIKSCFTAPEGWLLVGIDYASLEDYISALLTKDPNKLKVYMPIQIYKVEFDGQVYYLSDDDILEIDGKQYKPSELLKGN